MKTHYDLSHLHGLWLFVLFILMLGAGFIIIRRGASQLPPKQEHVEFPSIDLANTLFHEGPNAVGIDVRSLGYSAFTPDGKFFVFTGIADDNTATTYLVRLSDSHLTVLPSTLLGAVNDSRIIALADGEDLVLYEIATDTEKRIPQMGNIYAGILSPNGRTYVFNTSFGIRAYDMQRDSVSVVSNSQYDGATAWYADSQYMLGYHDSGENLQEAGKGRVFGRWNIPAQSFEPIAEGAVKQKTIRNVTWIVPGKVARVNAGYDDGSFDTLVDITTGKSTDLGETSSALAGGMSDDPVRGLFALITADEGSGEPRAYIYKGLDKNSETAVLPEYVRNNLAIVDDHTLLYLRQRITPHGPRHSIELVKLDTNTGIVTPIKVFDGAFATMTLAPDYKTWVVAAGDMFYTGVLE